MPDFAPLPILRYPDPRLHTVAAPVREVDARVRELIERMFATMYAANGIGLAATQVDVHERLIVIDVSEERNQRLVLINPVIEWASPETRKGEEGCLSVPGIYDGVERSVAVRVRALDGEGQSRVIEAEGIRDAQKVLSEGLNENIIRYQSIEAFKSLAGSPNAKVIITDGDTPFMIQGSEK